MLFQVTALHFAYKRPHTTHHMFKDHDVTAYYATFLEPWSADWWDNDSRWYQITADLREYLWLEQTMPSVGPFVLFPVFYSFICMLFPLVKTPQLGWGYKTLSFLLYFPTAVVSFPSMFFFYATKSTRVFHRCLVRFRCGDCVDHIARFIAFLWSQIQPATPWYPEELPSRMRWPA